MNGVNKGKGEVLDKFKQLLSKLPIDQISIGNQSFTFKEQFKIQDGAVDQKEM